MENLNQVKATEAPKEELGKFVAINIHTGKKVHFKSEAFRDAVCKRQKNTYMNEAEVAKLKFLANMPGSGVTQLEEGQSPTDAAQSMVNQLEAQSKALLEKSAQLENQEKAINEMAAKLEAQMKAFAEMQAQANQGAKEEPQNEPIPETKNETPTPSLSVTKPEAQPKKGTRKTGTKKA